MKRREYAMKDMTTTLLPPNAYPSSFHDTRRILDNVSLLAFLNIEIQDKALNMRYFRKTP
jgi:hypothetical protein